jgi:hypothetical protein
MSVFQKQRSTLIRKEEIAGRVGGYTIPRHPNAAVDSVPNLCVKNRFLGQRSGAVRHDPTLILVAGRGVITMSGPGNGDYNGTNDFGDSIVKLSGPSGGQFTVADWFTPWDWSSLSTNNLDLGSGGVLLLPTLTGVAHPQMLVQMGKDGTIHLIDRNTMGKLCSTCTSVDGQIVQEIPSATSGIFGSPAFWNNTVYWGGGNDAGAADNITAWSFDANGNGLLSTSPVSQTVQTFAFSTAAPVISANGNSNGILWILDNSTYRSSCCQVLYAFDATNLGTMLYNSNQAAGSRDVPGGAVKFTAPVVANGKVYVGSQGKVSAYGNISGTPNSDGRCGPGGVVTSQGST